MCVAWGWTLADPFTRLTAVAAPYDPVNVDTDQIFPGRFLKMPRSEGYGQYLFHDVRRLADGSLDPSFVLNQPDWQAASIFVGNSNFACGSSREGAAYAFRDAGFRCVIAPSFSDIFFNNCMRNGIVPVRLPAHECTALRAMLKDDPGAEVTVDLNDLQVTGPDGRVHAFKIDEFFRQMLLQGMDEVELTRSLLDQVSAFEKTYLARHPWVLPAS